MDLKRAVRVAGPARTRPGIWFIMANADAATIAQLALRLGLLTQDQLQEGWDEVGQRGGPPEPLVQALERKGHLTPLQSQKLLKGDPDGYFLGGYRILYKIASGSFGRVYRADDPRSGRVVAIKVLRQKWTSNKHGVELFEREGKVGMSLRHPNIVEVLAVSREASTGQHFIVMEFVEGGNLRELLRIRQKLNPQEALRILEDAANGLAYATSRGFSHRDMKLTNILISSQGAAKLVDFGLAGMGEMVHKDEAGQVDRTVDYAGLERATGVPPGDVRSDIYFMGCVAYELLTGRPPLEATRDKRLRMLKERYVAVKPLSSEEGDIPPAVIRLVETMMALDPLKRYQTPAQLLEAIREVRRELEAKGSNVQVTPSIFILEGDERLQDLLRQKFKQQGYRVLLAINPARALDRFRRQPFHALITDVGTVGEDGISVSERVLDEANRLGLPLVAILILGKEQNELAEKIPARPNLGVLLAPATMRQLQTKLKELLDAGQRSTGGPLDFGRPGSRPAEGSAR